MNAMSDPPTGQATPLISRRSVVIGGVLAAASGVAFARQPEIAAPQVKTDTFEKWVPDTFAGWSNTSASGVVLPPPDSLRDRLYDNLATRTYVAPSATIPIMLLLAYNNAQDGVLQVHRPEVCYPVGGFALSPTQNIALQAAGQSIPANFFTAEGPGRIEHVAYFTRLGTAFPRSWAEQRLAVVRANLAGVIPDGMLMRVSLISTNRDQARESLTAFATQFIEASPPPLRKRLIG